MGLWHGATAASRPIDKRWESLRVDDERSHKNRLRRSPRFHCHESACTADRRMNWRLLSTNPNASPDLSRGGLTIPLPQPHRKTTWRVYVSSRRAALNGHFIPI